MGDNMIPQNLKKTREDLELKQKDLAKFFKLAPSTISGWEIGKDTIPIKRLIKYANHFNLSLDYLFGITDINKEYKPIILDLNVVGKNLRNLRKNKNLTRQQIADKLNTHRAAYSHYENAHNLIPVSFLYELIDIYKDLSIDELFNREKK